jgi:hypothetical protein
MRNLAILGGLDPQPGSVLWKATVYVLSSTNYEENLKLYKRRAPMHHRGVEYADPAVTMIDIRTLNLSSGLLMVDQVHFVAEATAGRERMK